MLVIDIPKTEFFNEEDQTFLSIKEQKLVLEHSLVSMAKWESRWHKPFLSRSAESNLNHDEVMDYVKCMTITQNVDDLVYLALTPKNFKQITDYINDPMTATTITDRSPSKKASSEQLTAELLYYYMFQLNIPMECQKWHLNRLLMLIRVCSIKSQPEKKMGRGEALRMQRDLSEARKAKLRSKG